MLRRENVSVAQNGLGAHSRKGIHQIRMCEGGVGVV